MIRNLLPFVCMAFALQVGSVARAANYYVSSTNGNDSFPGTNWAQPKRTIQAALDLTVNNDTVLVSDGVYSNGGRTAVGQRTTNRVAVTNFYVTVQSVNGPAVTTIVGAGPAGNSAVRCAYLHTGCSLSGFTLTGGFTRAGGVDDENSGGGVFCAEFATVSNCVIRGNSSSRYGGGIYMSVGVDVFNSTLEGNDAFVRGGAVHCFFYSPSSPSTLHDCLVVSNSATSFGGGLSSCDLTNCTIRGNSTGSGVPGQGGGAYDCRLYNCTLSGNRSGTFAGDGGGAYLSGLNNCTVTGNLAKTAGGGTYNSTLSGCVVSFNTASNGGGVAASTVSDSQIFRNTASNSGGGVSGGVLYRTRVWSNTADFGGGVASNTCYDSPVYWNLARQSGGGADQATLYNSTVVFNQAIDDGGGTRGGQSFNSIVYFNTAGNVANSNYFNGSFAWSCASPLPSGSGNVDGNPQFMNVASNMDVRLLSVSPCVDAGNSADVSSGTDFAGLPRIAGRSVDMGAHEFVPTTWYVRPGGNDAAAGTSWATAKQTIQGAINAAGAHDAVIVSNGTYSTGGRVAFGSLTNRASITNFLSVRSVNGPAVTTIVGAGPLGNSAVRCVYVGSNSLLDGFTLSGGFTRTAGDTARERSGGGVWCENSGIVSNCIITGCVADFSGGGDYGGTLAYCRITGNAASNAFGGGAYGSTLFNSLITGNLGRYGGGGAYQATLYNCTVTGNQAPGGDAGGVLSSVVFNSIVYGNAAGTFASNQTLSTFTYSLGAPLPAGSGNLSGNPLFVNPAGDDYRLSGNSSCINAGTNSFATGSVDLLGAPRILGGSVDMGAFEKIPVYYVAPSGNDAAPGDTWSTAKQTIQAAVDAAVAGDTVWVSNGVYATGTQATPGFTTSNRVVITKNIFVGSVNGPAVTTIVGTRNLANEALSARCVYMSTGTLSGFTLTNGYAQSVQGANNELNRSGGGAYADGGTLTNCIITGNSTTNGNGGGVNYGTLHNCVITRNTAYDGGGANFATLNNCVLSGNHATDLGGGAAGGTLNNCLLVSNTAALAAGAAAGSDLRNCTLTANSAPTAGGVYLGTLNNCIVYYNADTSGFANHYFATLNYCCTTPLPGGGSGNITNQPLFLATNNYRIAQASPCFDTGNKTLAPTNTPAFDLDGNPRVRFQGIDIGAYEAQSATGYWAWTDAHITNGLIGYADQGIYSGYPNLLVYATGAAGESPYVADLGTTLSNGVVNVLFNRSSEASDVTLYLERGRTLSNATVWTSIATNKNGSWGASTNITDPTGGADYSVLAVDSSPGTNGFYRLRVARP